MTAAGDALLDICDKVVDIVGAGADAAVTATGGVGALTRFANSFIHQNVSTDTRRVHLRVAVDGRPASASTTRTDDEGLRSLVERTLDAARLRAADPDYGGLTPPTTIGGDPRWDDTTAQATPDDRTHEVAAFVDAGPGLLAAGSLATVATRTAFANSAGHRVVGASTSAILSGIHRAEGGDGSGRSGGVRLADVDGAGAGRRAAHKAAAQVDAIDLEPGAYEVVLEPGCVADMLLFLNVYGFNAKALADGMSFVSLGEEQFDAKITIVDDATHLRSVGLLFDAEGTPKQRLALVDRGRSTAVVHDRRTAQRAGTASTGHSVADPAIGAVATNMLVEPGDESRDELVASVDRGLLVTDFHYTRILDPKTQVVTGLTRNGVFLIEKGQVTRPVKNLRFTQSYVGALGPGKVLGVGNDVTLAQGQLGGGALVPSVRLASWNFPGGARG